MPATATTGAPRETGICRSLPGTLSPAEVAALERWTWSQLARCMALGRRARALRRASAELAAISENDQVRAAEQARIERLDAILATLRKDYAALASPDPEGWLELLGRQRAGHQQEVA